MSSSSRGKWGRLHKAGQHLRDIWVFPSLSSGLASLIFFLVAKHPQFHFSLDSPPCAALVGNWKGSEGKARGAADLREGDPRTRLPPFHPEGGGSESLTIGAPFPDGAGGGHPAPPAPSAPGPPPGQCHPVHRSGSSQPHSPQRLQGTPKPMGYLGVCFWVTSKATQGSRRERGAPSPCCRDPATPPPVPMAAMGTLRQGREE